MSFYLVEFYKIYIHFWKNIAKFLFWQILILKNVEKFVRHFTKVRSYFHFVISEHFRRIPSYVRLEPIDNFDWGALQTKRAPPEPATYTPHINA